MSEDWVKNSNANRIGIAASNLFGDERAEHDYYAAEPKAVELLCEIESFSSRSWEPACSGSAESPILPMI